MSSSVLLLNLGSPDSPHPHDVKKYLDEFLNDPYVIDLPWVFRKILVNGIILRSRPAHTARAYSKIWEKDGSPLITVTKKLRAKLQDKLNLPVYLAMRYGSPSIDAILNQMKKEGIKETLFIPLYPQYSYATTESSIVQLTKLAKKSYPQLKIKIVKDFFNFEPYLQALTQSLQNQLQSCSVQPDSIIFSYHGVPTHQLLKVKEKPSSCKTIHAETEGCCNTFGPHNRYCYRAQCFETTRLVCQKLNWPLEKTKTTFQSRLGKTPWITPYTDLVLAKLPQEGIKNILILSPSFTADCLETLEEIKIQYQELFLKSGGHSLQYIPCLNDHDDFVSALSELVLQYN